MSDSLHKLHRLGRNEQIAQGRNSRNEPIRSGRDVARPSSAASSSTVPVPVAFGAIDWRRDAAQTRRRGRLRYVNYETNPCARRSTERGQLCPRELMEKSGWT